VFPQKDLSKTPETLKSFFSLLIGGDFTDLNPLDYKRVEHFYIFFRHPKILFSCFLTNVKYGTAMSHEP
jgi:hypothetical protein